MIKKILTSTIITILLTSSLVFAIGYTAEPASFDVYVNGVEFHSDPPPMVVEGRTYLPLRAIGDALGIPVGWNAELNRAEVGNITKYYDRTTVIDFGAFLGIEPAEKPEMTITDNGSFIMYVYDMNDFSAEGVKKYAAAVAAQGYGNIEDENGLLYFTDLNDETKNDFFIAVTDGKLKIAVITNHIKN